MKKVWILEKFETIEDLNIQLNDLKESLNREKIKNSPTYMALINKAIEHKENVIKENPEGRWTGWEGKTDYNSFIKVAKEAISYGPETLYRVVEAEIEDNAKYWLDYINPVENIKVTNYLIKKEMN